MASREITGVVLAGGRSRRMGRNKAEIEWNSGTLLSHALVVLQSVAAKVFVVGLPQTQTPGAEAIADEFPGRGPLGGIHAALKHTATDWIFVLAVDLPLVSSKLVSFIAGACEANAFAVVPRVGDRLQPLCAAYHRRLLPEVERAIAGDDLSVHRLLERVSTGMMEKQSITKIIEQKDIVRHGFLPEMLANVNTPEELERARAIASKLHGN
jgi:molybdopterin-guanine dinucleotide biosynthesis protein A